MLENTFYHDLARKPARGSMRAFYMIIFAFRLLRFFLGMPLHHPVRHLAEYIFAQRISLEI
jgi:hypothetical protein